MMFNFFCFFRKNTRGMIYEAYTHSIEIPKALYLSYSFRAQGLWMAPNSHAGTCQRFLDISGFLLFYFIFFLKKTAIAFVVIFFLAF